MASLSGKISFKNRLQEYAQRNKKQGRSLPIYHTEQDVISLKFLGTVKFEETNYQSEGLFQSKKLAEQSAAKIACSHFGLCNVNPLPSLETEDPLYLKPEVGGASVTAESVSDLSLVDDELDPVMKAINKENKRLQSVTSSLKETLLSEKPIKSKLYELCQKQKVNLPTYHTYAAERGGFHCDVSFMDKQFCCMENVIFKSKKEAEQNASEICFNAVKDEPMSLNTTSGFAPSNSSSLTTVSQTESYHHYNSVLHEYLQQRNLPAPEFVYKTNEADLSFEAQCIIANQGFGFCMPCRRKKDAKHLAAKLALHGFEGENMENILSDWEQNRGKKRPSQSSENDEGNLSLSQKKPQAKRERLETTLPSLATIMPKVNGISLTEMKDLAVGEIWQEKKNTVVIGNKDFSILLRCQGPNCSIYTFNSFNFTSLQPGSHLIGLESRYCQVGGRVELQAKLCKEIVNCDDNILPVLISSGIIFIRHVNSLKTDQQVLLKRYKYSPMFVQPAASLAQFFRQYSGNNRPSVSIESLTANISKWLNSELSCLGEMTPKSIKQLLHHTWKVKPKWQSILEGDMPFVLKQLRDCANAELIIRRDNKIDTSKDDTRAWGLPKGNMRNKISSTGVVMETDVDCALRELKEESRLSISKERVDPCRYAEDFATDDENANPHKGDFTRYFIVVDASAEENQHLAISSSKLSELSSANDLKEDIIKETVSDDLKMNEEKKADDDNDVLIMDDEKSSINTAGGEDSITPKESAIAITDEKIIEIKSTSQTPSDELECSFADDETTTDGDVFNIDTAHDDIELPSPRPPKHEECQWFSLDAALEQSPALRRMADTDSFKYHMQLLCPSFNQN